jgi:hypothetical protein
MSHQSSDPTPVRRYHTNNTMTPQSGGYRVSAPPVYVPKTYFINARTSPGPRVLRALNSSEKDLDDNRCGYLSPTQRQRLLRKNTEWVSICFVGAMILTWPIAQILSGTREAVISWLWTMVIWSLFLKEFYDQTLIHRALLVGRVEAVRGQVRVNGSISVHDDALGIDKEFAVTRDIYQGFVYNEDYTLYFLPHIDQLVSAEHHPVSYHG